MLPCSQDAFTGPCTEEAVSSSHSQIICMIVFNIILMIVFNIILTPTRRFSNGLFTPVFRTEVLIDSYCLILARCSSFILTLLD